MRFHHMAILVSDLERAIRLWRDVLGFELVIQTVIPDGTVAGPNTLMHAQLLDDIFKVSGARSRMAWLRSAEGAMIELQQCENPPIQRTPPDRLRYADTGIHELGLAVDDIEYWFKTVRDAGYETQTAYIWWSRNSARSFVFYDDDGNMIQLWQQIPRAQRPTPISTGAPG